MKMKKVALLSLSLLFAGSLVACAGENNKTEAPTTTPTTEPTVEPTVKPTPTVPENESTYPAYVAAKLGDEVTVRGYIQDKQGWWENKATIYLQDNVGAYFLYELPCTKEQYDKDLKIGNQIEVTGIKGAWAGMTEVLGSEAGAEATYKVLEGTKVYEAKPLEGLDSKLLLEHLTQKVSIANLTVVDVQAPEKSGGDIYFDVTDGTSILTFCVESYLRGADTEVYKTALALKAGDVISTEGYMYCYNNPQLHTIAITVSNNVLTKTEGALSYSEYVAKADGETVVIEGFIQARQGWWENKATFYVADNEGAYFVYQLPCTKEDFDTKLTVGTRIKVTGQKGSWSGMTEILGSEAGAEATYEVLEGKYLTKAKDATSLFGTPELLALSTQRVLFKGLEVTKVQAPEKSGGDIYYDVKLNDKTLTFCVESYLTGADTEVYKTALALKVGDKINCEGFLYIYKDAQLHTTAISAFKEAK